MSGFWLSSNQLPHWVSNLAKPTKPSQQSHTWRKTCNSDLTPGWKLVAAPSLKCEGMPCHSETGKCFVASVLHAWPPHNQTRSERESAWRWSLGSQKDLWCGPSFSLGWDKPGSVAPLRLVGCLIETPAPSWAYFYSIFSLSFFSSPLLSPLLLSFFNSPLLPSLSISLPLSSSSVVFRCVSACMHDRGKKKKTYTSWFLVWIPKFTCFFPFSVLLYLFCTDICQDGKSSVLLVWQYPCSVYIQSA